MQLPKLNEWPDIQLSNNPLLIAGPCGAENPEQLMAACQAAKAAGAQLLRAGIWKPRTRPDSFEGNGETALRWLQDVKQETGLPASIEVATAEHVEKALRYEVDVLWVGARTSVSPFSMQELADALRGVDIPVMVKNPINPDLGLWIGAIERLYKAGTSQIAAIHRGFSVYKSAPYRNAPMWQIPIELKRRLPSLPLICDPSHISGKRELVPGIAQIANELDYDGWMIEVHPQPAQALSDAAQQLKPRQLLDLMQTLKPRHAVEDDPRFTDFLDEQRGAIDTLDKEIIALLAARMRISQKIGDLKRAHGVTVFQLDRWSQIFDSRIADTIQAGLSADFAMQFMQCIHQESIRQQLQDEDRIV